MAEEMSALVPDALERRVRTLLERAGENGHAIATAESCTGGLLASLLTDIEGASSAFDRGFVTYSDHAKCDLLGLAHETIDRCGAVSETVAIAMAKGAIAGSKADVAVAITGFAGPAGPNDEVGLVHFATCTRGGETRHREEHFGLRGRGPVRLAALAVAVTMLEEAMADAPAT